MEAPALFVMSLVAAGLEITYDTRLREEVSMKDTRELLIYLSRYLVVCVFK
jgi:hypothetical protein